MRRRRTPTLRTRVVTGVLAVVMVALAASGFTAVTAFRDYLLAQTDSELRSIIDSYSARVQILADGKVPVTIGATGGFSASGTAKSNEPVIVKSNASGTAKSDSPLRAIAIKLPSVIDNYYVEFTDHTRKVMATERIVQGNKELIPRMPSDLAALAAAGRPETVPSLDGQGQLRLLATRVGSDGTLIATASLASLDSAVASLQRIVVAGTLTVALVVVAGVGLVVRRGLRPVEAMAAAAARITAGDLTTRVAPQDPVTEVGRLGAALNGMLCRIEAAVRERGESEEATRRFFADASHELRTPLASLRANAELYQQGALRTRPALDEAMRRITGEARRMGTLVDDMLRLARLDQHPGMEHSLADLTELTTECTDRARVADPDRRWSSHVKPGLVVSGDPELLCRAIDNLLSNVTAHTPPETSTTVSASAADGRVTVEISDDGPGVADEHLPRIFDRFYRVRSHENRPGSGLGLAIVAAIITDHDGSVSAESVHPHGLRITLSLPGRSPSG
jgi:two-component system OmpR family sensor kinase